MLSQTGPVSNPFYEHCQKIAVEEEYLKQGGDSAGHERQKKLGRLWARARIEKLIDPGTEFFEVGLWSAYQMYPDWGKVPAAGVITGVGRVSGHPCMIVANDATVKAGAFFPQTAKKIIRAQRIAFECSLPLIYLVDSAGIFLPLQDEVFPDEDDFGRIFRNNAVLSAAGIPQYAAIMGNCVAGGAYLPVLCDKILMTEGSGLYLAGPSLVKAAIGQEVDPESLGGATMHSRVSGTVDFHEKDDESCLKRLRGLLDLLPRKEELVGNSSTKPEWSGEKVYEFVSVDGRKEYDARDLIRCIADAGTIQEYKAEYGQSIVTAYAKLGGQPIGIVANQRKRTQSANSGLQLGGVIYAESADKAARFVMDCNETGTPLIFLQDVQGFMVGKDAEQSGIIRSGAKLVNAVSNCVVPKITVVVGSSFGAGNYAMCGKAFDPRLIFAWPHARYAVMGGDQAAETLFMLMQRAQKSNHPDQDVEDLRKKVKQKYEEQTDIRYGAARGWVDAIIQPENTRKVLLTALQLVMRKPPEHKFHTGVIQV